MTALVEAPPDPRTAPPSPPPGELADFDFELDLDLVPADQPPCECRPDCPVPAEWVGLGSCGHSIPYSTPCRDYLLRRAGNGLLCALPGHARNLTITVSWRPL